MRNLSLIALALCCIALSGCLVRAATNVVSAPARAVSKGVDLATTSQSEADEKRGRELRKREERLGRLERRYRAERKACNEGDDDMCDSARATYREIIGLRESIPVRQPDN